MYFESNDLLKVFFKKQDLTVALVMRKSDSWVTVSTSGELFMMVLTLAKGKFAPPREFAILTEEN